MPRIRSREYDLRPLRRFKIPQMKFPTRIVVIGQSGSGKTQVGLDIMYHFKDYIFSAMVISTSEQDKAREKKDYYGIVPDSFLHDTFDPNIIDNMFLRQKSLIYDFDKRPDLVRRLGLKRNILLVADDCMHEKAWKRSPETGKLFFQGRHAEASFLLMMQYPMGIMPELRGQLQYVFIFPSEDSQLTKRYFINYCEGVIPDRATFDIIYNSLLRHKKEHYCLVIDRTNESADWQDKIFWFKAQLHPKFRICHEIIWRFHIKNYNKHYQLKEINDALKKKKSKDTISIKLSKKGVSGMFNSTNMPFNAKEIHYGPGRSTGKPKTILLEDAPKQDDNVSFVAI